MADLNALIAAGVDDRLTGEVDVDLFSPAYSSGGANTWNTGCWIGDLDVTGFSPHNDVDAKFGGTLISPRHVLFVHDSGAHSTFTPDVGTTMFFVKADGSEYTTVVTGKRTMDGEGWTPRLGVCYLDMDTPTGIRFYEILPTDHTDFFARDNKPTAFITYHTDSGIEPNVTPNSVQVGEIVGDSFVQSINSDPSASSPRSTYWHGIDSGDSGHPSFLIIDSELVLLGIHYARTGHNFLHDMFVTFTSGTAANSTMDRINDLMTLSEADGGGSDGYQLTTYDLSVVLQSVSQVTALSVMGIPGPARSFVAKTAAGKRIFDLAAFQIRIDGITAFQVRVDGAVEHQTRVDGVAEFQVEPN